MNKKIISLLLSVLFVIPLIGCDDLGIAAVLALDEGLHYAITCVGAERITEQYIIYENQRYICTPSGLFLKSVGFLSAPLEGDILLSWNGARWFYKDTYYSYTKETPVFIYESRLGFVYIREDYDFLSDVFVVNGTEQEVVFSDIFSDYYSYTDVDDFTSGFAISMYAKQHPRLTASLTVCFENGICYVHTATGPDGGKWQASDAFVKLLEDGGFL